MQAESLFYSHFIVQSTIPIVEYYYFNYFGDMERQLLTKYYILDKDHSIKKTKIFLTYRCLGQCKQHRY